MTYRDRREARAERLRGWAEGRDAKSAARLDTARTAADAIPMGQPILVGHYSEGRDRRYRARIDANMRAGVEHARKADEMRRKADNIDAAADRAIYSDDPDAVERLAEKLERLEAERARIKAYNATCRKGRPDLELLDGRQRASLASATRVGMGGKAGAFPGYALTNLGGTITATRKRLASLTPGGSAS